MNGNAIARIITKGMSHTIVDPIPRSPVRVVIAMLVGAVVVSGVVPKGVAVSGTIWPVVEVSDADPVLVFDVPISDCANARDAAKTAAVKVIISVSFGV